jgi:hypothetical protein
VSAIADDIRVNWPPSLREVWCEEQHISEWHPIGVSTGMAGQTNADCIQDIHDYHLDG